VERVALIGTGTMGAPIAANLDGAGFAVAVWNRTGARADALRGEGIEVAETPAAAARSAEAIGIVVTDDRAVESVLEGADGVLAGLEAGALVVDMTTTSVGSKRRSAERVRVGGGRFVDSPVFGSRPQAEQGALWAVVGADPADLPSAHEFLSRLGRRGHDRSREGAAP
jgi:3-hydroxyisobutyrate dehydrogenase-like beta-hydroxyacid dehydrogenase